MNDLDKHVIYSLAIIAFFFLVGVLIYIVDFFRFFTRELRFINIEIQRSDGEEKHYWKIQRRKLWLSLFPFVKY